MSAAVGAVLYGAISTSAQTITWDPSGANPPVDGSGNWDTASLQWYDPGSNSVVAWNNATPDSAVLGTGNSSSTSPFNVLLNANITVQNLTLANASPTSYYNIGDQGDGAETLTLAGNFLKSSTIGGSVFSLTNPLDLTSGTHIFTLQDSPGDAPPEVTMNNGLTGSGAVTLDNGFNSSGYPQWGTLVFNVDSNYSGGTNVVKGRLVANTSNGLGTGTVTISSQGNLAFGGASTSPVGNLNITNPVVITRNTYTGTDYNDYPDAITSNNTGNPGEVITFSGPFTVDSNDARVAANTSTVIISSNIQQGPDVTAGVLTLDGDFAGFVTLSGNNTALLGGIKIIGGVEVNVSNQNNLGGASSPITMSGGTLHPVGGFMTDFGTHVLNVATFNGGIDVDANQTFNIDTPLGDGTNQGGSLGKRGLGTLNITAPVNLTNGQTFFDSGTVNVSSSVTLASLHLRSPVLNITTGGVITTVGGFDSLGSDTTGTNGGPDMATVSLTGSGALIEATGDDFNVSDNAQTTGTINMYDNSVLTTGGITWLGKSNGAVGTINQHGGTLTINRNGNFGFVIADGRSSGTPTGYYNLSSGTFNDENGEIYVGEGSNGTGHGVGNWTQAGGTATFGNWFVVGREGAQGTVLISGGTLTKDTSNGGANVSIGEGGANVCTLTVDGNGAFNVESGQAFVGNNSSVGIMNVGSPTDPVNAAPSFTVNNWFAVGRNGTSVGTLNLYDGSVTDNNSLNNNWFDIGGDGGSAHGTVNVYGGTLTAIGTWIGENGSCVGVLNMNGGNASLGTVELALANTATGTINLNGGILSGTSFTAQNSGGTGTPKIVFNGGTLEAPANEVQNNFVGMKITSVVSTGGAIINANGGYINFNSALTHDTSLGGADGGLTVTGTGTVQLGTTGAHAPINTYTGPTTILGGTLILSTAGTLPTGGNVANSAAFVVGANSTAGNVSGTGTTTVNSGVAFTASNFTQGSLANNGTVTVNGSGTVGPISGSGTLAVNGTLHLAASSGLSTMGSLSVGASGTFDITNNHVIINYGAGPDPISSIAALLAAGYNGGAWNGANGITSSTVATNPGYSVGYADAADPGNPAGLASGTIEVAYTLIGDADLNHTVNGIDFGILAANFNKTVTGWDKGDFDYNGIVNGIDFTALAANFNKAASGASGGATAADFAALDQFAAANGLLADVPEPASLGLAIIGSAGLLARRRRRRNA
jgi:autotransporter-associated beta strand protein